MFPSATRIVGAEHVLFGTDFPLIKHPRLLAQVRESGLSAEEQALITGGNAAKLLRAWRLTTMETLPDHLQPGLDIVLVGLNPSIPSAQTGRYFANPRNRFWRAFNAAGLTPEALGPETDHRMLEFGIGMTDVVKRPTAGVSDLKAADFREGASDLQGKAACR